MTQWKRTCILVIILLMIQLPLSIQPVEAGRGRGFSIGEFIPLGLFPIMACASGLELEYIYQVDAGKDFDELIGAFDIVKLAAAIVTTDENGNSITGDSGTEVVTVPLTFHDGEKVFNPKISNWYAGNWRYEHMIASASERIPESATGNVRLYWSDFGLQPTVGDDVVIVSKAPALGEDLQVLPEGIDIYSDKIGFNYYNDWFVIIVHIEDDCEGVFPSMTDNCEYATVDVTGTDLDVTVTPTEDLYDWGGEVATGVIEFSDYTTIGQQSILADIIGQISLPNNYDPDDYSQAYSQPVYVNVEPIGEYYPAAHMSTMSEHGYVYSFLRQPTANFTAIVTTFRDNEAAIMPTLPLGLVLYNTYTSTVWSVNITEPTFRYVGGRTTSATDRIYFSPLVAPTTLKITGVYLNNLDANSAIRFSASAGGVSVSQTPGQEGKVNIVELLLTDVPRGTNQLDFTIEAPGTAEDTALLTGIALSYPCLDAVDNVAEIRETRTAPLIDGLVDPAWQSASSYALKSLLTGNGPLTAADFSVNFRSLYDSDNLYVLIETTDDALYNDSGDQLELDDTVKLYLDTNFSQGLTYDNVDDRATFFRWNDPVTYKSPQSPTLPPGLQKSIVNTTNGYLVELRLPLSEIGLPPTPGYLFGLDVHAHDDDNGGEQEHKLAWNTLGSGIHRNPSLMGIGRLVAAANTLPIANDDAATTQQNITLNGATVLANDNDPDGDPLTVSATPISGPSNGSLALNGNGTYVYTPNPGFVGNDSFVYEVSDGKGGSDTATVTISVTITVQPVNRPPVANDDTATVQQNTTLTGASVLANDSDPDGDPLTVTATPISGPSNGSLVLNSNGSYVYTPNPGFVGNDSFVYAVSDGKGGSDTATVRITVQKTNRPPVANPDSATTAQDTTLNGPSLLANDSDPDGDLLTINTTPVTGPGNGSLVINANGTYVYRPTGGFVGTDRFTYAVSDGNGGSSTATVTIAVTAVLGTSSRQYYLPFILAN